MNNMRFTLFFIFLIQNLILCQDDVDIQLIEEIAQKDAMEDINLFKYRESYYVPEERILNFNKNYSDDYYKIYEYSYISCVENYYGKVISDLEGVFMVPSVVLSVGCFSSLIIGGIAYLVLLGVGGYS